MIGLVVFLSHDVSAQSEAGPIAISEFADSTNVKAGDNFPQPLFRNTEYSLKGSYGNIGAATWVRASYDIYKSDWSGLDYSEQFIIADDTTGVLDGSINATFQISDSAALTADLPGAFPIIQIRVNYDPAEDTFWNIFVEVQDSANLTTGINGFLPIEGLKVYPNPVEDRNLHIESPKNLLKNIRILDLAGKELVVNTSMINGILDLSALHTGMYLVRIEEEEKVSIAKIILK